MCHHVSWVPLRLTVNCLAGINKDAPTSITIWEIVYHKYVDATFCSLTALNRIALYQVFAAPRRAPSIGVPTRIGNDVARKSMPIRKL